MLRFEKVINGFEIKGKGDETMLDRPMVIVEGSRRATPYGMALARMCGRAVAERGLALLTTAAIGCDSDAARAALEAGGDVVIACGFGVDHDPYPSASSDVFMAAKCVISLEGWDNPPIPYAFRRRNDLMAGLADLCVVCECGQRSGTRDLAGKCGDVWAFPGSIFSQASQGCNELIACGATAVLSEQHLSDMLDARYGTVGSVAAFDRPSDAIGNALAAMPMRPTELADGLGMDAVAVWRALAGMEVDGKVECMPDGRYACKVRRIV